ncbi:hypothetical protein N8737_02005 [Verrucomicrobia bacterium]|jgi:hypothetical protein|nr:hypothetical protein [bacterium]MDA7657453.1 hypothetical protein [Verrucomicrobiota bacterium]MDB4746425.1 hypothetical protein [Verrucomicrobiota bacterium]
MHPTILSLPGHELKPMTAKANEDCLKGKKKTTNKPSESSLKQSQINQTRKQTLKPLWCDPSHLQFEGLLHLIDEDSWLPFTQRSNRILKVTKPNLDEPILPGRNANHSSNRIEQA